MELKGLGLIKGLASRIPGSGLVVFRLLSVGIGGSRFALCVQGLGCIDGSGLRFQS